MKKVTYLSFYATLTLCAASGAFNNAVLAQNNRPANPFATQFRRTWDLRLQEPAKLVEIGPIANDKNNRVVLLIGGKNKDDYKRKLLILRWNGLQFNPEYTSPEFLGVSVDTLLVGPFRDGKTGTKPAKDQGSKAPNSQVITTKSVYSYFGTGYSRLFDAPPDIRAALFLEKPPAQLIVGQGDSAVAHQMSEAGIAPSVVEPPSTGPGFVRFGVGTQDVPLFFRGGIRYIQSHWDKRNRWFVCLQPGTPANLPDAPSHATTGDRLIIYTPRFENREKSFWSTSPEDLEEAWRSEPLPGRVLDVRIGDPKNEGQEGILVLTSENNDKDRYLHFFALASGINVPAGNR